MNRRLLLLFCLAPGIPSLADDQSLPDGEGYEPGHGAVSMTFQALEVDTFRVNSREVDIGRGSTRSAYLELELAIAERWKLTAGLPWIRKRYDGPAPHETGGLDPPWNQARFLDDGRYHASTQDWLLGITYLVDTQPYYVQAFLHAHVPSKAYPHYAQAAVGQNLWKVEVGAEATRFLPFSDWYYRWSASYVFVEQTLNQSVNHFRVGAEAGYFLSPEFSISMFIHAKDGRGREPVFANLRDEYWYQHDRLVHHSYLNAGIGTDWFPGERYQYSAALFRSFWGKTVHLVDWGVTFGVTRYF